MALFQQLCQALVVLLVLLHGPEELLLGLGHGGNLGGQHKLKAVLLHIALALHAEGGDAVAGNLGQQGAGHPLDAKGEAGVLNGAFVANGMEHLQKRGRLLLGKALVHRVDVRGGVAQLGGAGHGLFRLWRIGQKLYLHVIHPFRW